MYATFNGYLAKDAELKQSKNGKDYLTFSVANNVGFGDNKKVNWINCSDFKQSAMKLSEYLKKGTHVLVNGTVSLNEYENQHGVTVKFLNCVCSDIRLLSSKKDSEQSEAPNNSVTISEDEIPF